MESSFLTDATSLLSIRDNIQIAMYDFRVYFTSITSLSIVGMIIWLYI